MTVPRRRRTRRGPKQAVIIDEIRGWIIGGALRAGDRLPPYVDLQDRFGVTPVTMKRAIARLKEDGYVVTRGARGSFVADHPPHLCTIGLVFVARPGEAGWSTAYEALTLAAREAEDVPALRFVVYHDAAPDDTTGDYRRLEADVEAHRVGGLVFAENPFMFQSSPVLHEPGTPRVGIMSQPRPELPAVYYDQNDFWDHAIGALAAEGRKRLAALVLPMVSHEWTDKLCAKARAAGMEADPRWVQSVAPTHPDWAANAVRMLFHEGQDSRPDALVIGDDHLVTAATNALAAMGLNAPDQVGVAAHFNLGCKPATPFPVRFFAFDVRALLQACLARMEEQRRGQPSPPITHVAVREAQALEGSAATAP
ncbi:MAG: GntR family transcriptional regulator [Planctomycetota bacterium]